MTSLAIVGAGGVLGTKLVERALVASDDTIHAYTHGSTSPRFPAAASPRVTWQPLDIANAEAVVQALTRPRPRPAAVINCAALTNVDACETQREAAHAANAAGPRHLAEACVRLGVPLVHLSTDYVFPGDDAQPGPYREDASVHPVNHYGWTKLEGERAVIDTCAGRCPWLIARTALVYGYVPGGRINFISWLAGELRDGRRVRVVNDQVNTPTLAADLAEALLHLLRAGGEGLIHVAGPDLVARDQWARSIAAHFHLDVGLIEVTTTAQLGQPAHRPLRSGLRTWRAGELADVTIRGILSGLEAFEQEQEGHA
jgi:dTDP-4-dehydrorhamnose reductase